MVPLEELEQPSPPPRSWRAIAIVLVVALVAGALAYGLLRPAPPSRTSAGRDVPDFTLQRLDGKGSISSEDLRGKPLVINFWASWCEPCKKEMPLFQRAWKEYGDAGVTILGVNLRDARANATEFVDEQGISYPVVVDADETLADALDVGGLPQTFFVGSDWSFQSVGGDSGTVVLGAISAELLNDEIEEMLAAAP